MLPLFSQRRELTPIRKKIQIESIDDELRNRLWSGLKIYYWDRIPDYFKYSKHFYSFIIELWDSFFKQPIDNIADNWKANYNSLREYFLKCRWYRVYDLIEFIVNIYPTKSVNQKFMNYCNKILEEESSAYRFVGGRIIQITSEEEISEIEEALATPLDPVKTHIKTALDLISDRKAPDYRNSIKESICAVEAICRLITEDEKATLGQCLNVIESKVSLHPALKRAFSSLYGYTSSADGIRHALLEEPTLSFEDAKFMLVSCSAFVNYLISKASKAKIKI